MVTDNTIYTQRVFHILSTDIIEEPIQNGDIIICIDTGEQFYWDAANEQQVPIPPAGVGFKWSDSLVVNVDEEMSDTRDSMIATFNTLLSGFRLAILLNSPTQTNQLVVLSAQSPYHGRLAAGGTITWSSSTTINITLLAGTSYILLK